MRNRQGPSRTPSGSIGPRQRPTLDGRARTARGRHAAQEVRGRADVEQQARLLGARAAAAAPPARASGQLRGAERAQGALARHGSGCVCVRGGSEWSGARSAEGRVRKGRGGVARAPCESSWCVGATWAAQRRGLFLGGGIAALRRRRRWRRAARSFKPPPAPARPRSPQTASFCGDSSPSPPPPPPFTPSTVPKRRRESADDRSQRRRWQPWRASA
jgi:hypothetical protein